MQLLLSVHVIGFVSPCNCCCLSIQLLLSDYAISDKQRVISYTYVYSLLIPSEVTVLRTF
jgi:hypothetical protein